MRCISCQNQIDPKFKHAISQNQCPMCGGAVMSVELHKILNKLQKIMEEAKPFMVEIEGWLFTNYSIGKSKQQNQRSDNSNSSETDEGGIFDTDMDEETIRKQTELAKQFQQRAGVPKVNSGLKSVVNQIKAAGTNADISEFVGVDPDYGPIDMSKEVSAPLSSEEKDQMKSIINAQYSVKETAQENAVREYYELQKVKKLQEQSQKLGPKFSRHDD